MDFERFKEWAIGDISSRLPSEFKDAELYFEEVKKYGGNYTGLFLKKPGSSVSPTVNMEQFYGFYLNGAEKEKLGRIMAEMLQYHVNENDLDMEWISEYDKAKDHFFICLSNAEGNPGYLEGVPHIIKTDLAITCHILSEIPGEGYIGTVVNDALLKDYGISEEKLFEDAFRSSADLMPLKMEFARDIYSEDGEIDEDDAFYNMLVISNEKHFRGSAALFYPGTMEKAAMVLGGSYYILPSSVHEVLAIPAESDIRVSDLQMLVMEANLMHVKIEERLSDSVYYYDANTGELIRTEPGGGCFN